MRDLRSAFNTWYFNEFCTSQLFADMLFTVEDSPWHREANVGVHTNMVVGQFVGMAEFQWAHTDLLGALACAFHDVGKPDAEEVRHSKERGTYRRYTGHELISARLWENYAVTHWDELHDLFGLQPEDIYRVGWVIEHHLPYGVTKKDKVEAMVRSAIETVGSDVFSRVLKADTLGKVCDDHEEKIRNNEEWVREFFSRPSHPRLLAVGAPVLYMLIGASGSGKSTFTVDLDATSYSWDQLRLDWYVDKDDRKLPVSEQYRIAFERSTKDKEFNSKVNAEFHRVLGEGGDIVIDNTNTSNKRRKFFCNEARNRGYKVVAVLFPIDLRTLISRQDTRADKSVPDEAVRRQYMGLQYPFYGDFDEIQVVSTNL